MFQFLSQTLENGPQSALGADFEPICNVLSVFLNNFVKDKILSESSKIGQISINISADLGCSSKMPLWGEKHKRFPKTQRVEVNFGSMTSIGQNEDLVSLVNLFNIFAQKCSAFEIEK